jgi:hypothetical protein
MGGDVGRGWIKEQFSVFLSKNETIFILGIDKG